MACEILQFDGPVGEVILKKHLYIRREYQSESLLEICTRYIQTPSRSLFLLSFPYQSLMISQIYLKETMSVKESVCLIYRSLVLLTK